MTTAARIFGALLAIVGFAYGAMAIYAFFNIDDTATFLDWLKAPEYKEFGPQTIDEWKRGAWFNASLFFVVGVAAAVCGTGIAALREWARRSWLIASGLLVVFVLVVAITAEDGRRRYLELLAFALPSFVLLRMRLTKNDGAI
jgi:hypothetical protein